MVSTCTTFLLCSKIIQRNYRHFFSRFQTKEQVLRVNKSKIGGGTYLMWIIFGLKLTIDEVKRKRVFLGYFCRFISSALILRPRNTYIYVSRVLFLFCKFLITSCGFSKLAVSSFYSTTKFK